MDAHGTVPKVVAILISWTLAVCSVTSAAAQGPGVNRPSPARVQVSANADFSTTDSIFGSGDYIHLRVHAPNVDPASIEVNEFSISPRGSGAAVAGMLRNRLDGTFTTRVAASELEGVAAAWRLRVTIEDEAGRSVQAAAQFALHEQERYRGMAQLRTRIQAIGDSVLSAGGQRIMFNHRTSIRNRNGAEIAPIGLMRQEVLMLVRHTRWGFHAHAVRQAHSPGPVLSDDQFEIEGEISAIGDSWIEVGGATIHVDEATSLVWRGVPFEFDRLVVGMVVSVIVVEQDGAGLLASHIRVVGLRSLEVSLRDAISSISGDRVTVGETSFSVLPGTRISGPRGEKLDLSSLEIGQLVHVVLAGEGPDTYFAVLIKIAPDPARRRVAAAGPIEEVDASGLMVRGIRFTVDDETEVTDQFGEPAHYDSLGLGQRVRVLGVVGVGGSNRALEIRLRTRFTMHARLEGILTNVTGESIEVDGIPIAINPMTQYRGRAQSAAELQIGQDVLVHAVETGDADLVALMVVVHGHQRHQNQVRGEVDSLGTDFIVVTGLSFGLGTQTTFWNQWGERIGPNDLAPGQTVALQYAVNAHARTAVRIRHVECRYLSGMLVVEGNGVFRVGETAIRVDERTLVAGDWNSAQALDGMSGVYVEVFAAVDEGAGGEGGSTLLLADRVRVFATGVSTGNEGRDDGVPASFSLSQNYPNPFNPGTTITFELTNPTPVQVHLAVYNVLGQQIATLVNGMLGSGTHHIAWNGRDDGGASAGSGVYLYRLSVGGRASSRTMLLVR